MEGLRELDKTSRSQSENEWSKYRIVKWGPGVSDYSLAFVTSVMLFFSLKTS